MTRTMLDITEDLRALDDLITERDGDITGVEESIDAWMAELDKDLKGKVDNYCALLTMMNARSSMRREESERLNRLAATEERSIESMRARLKFALEARGVTKLDCPRYKVGIVRNGGAAPVIIESESAIPETFCRVMPATRVPDKDKIREALAKDLSVPGARLGERTMRLSIR